MCPACLQVKNFAEVFNDRLLASTRGKAASAPEETAEQQSQRRETERLRAEVAGHAGLRAQLFRALAEEDASRRAIDELRAELSEARTALRSGAAALSISLVAEQPEMDATEMAQAVVERGLELEGSARHVADVVNDEFQKATNCLRSLERAQLESTQPEVWPGAELPFGAEEGGHSGGGAGRSGMWSEQLQHASACLMALGTLRSRLAEEMQAGTPASFQGPLTPQAPSLLPLLETRAHPHAGPQAFPASHYYQKHAGPRSDSSSPTHWSSPTGRARRPAPAMGRPPRPSHHLMPLSASSPQLGLKHPPRTSGQSAQWQGGTHGNRMVAPWTPEGSPEGSQEKIWAGGVSLPRASHEEGPRGRSRSSTHGRPPTTLPTVSSGLRGGTQSAMPVRSQHSGSPPAVRSQPPAPSRTFLCDTTSPASSSPHAERGGV